MVNTEKSRKPFFIKPFFTILSFMILCLSFVNIYSTPVFADKNAQDDNTVETIFFGEVKDDGKGCGVFIILDYVIDVLSFGIGIAAAIGITISGITYLTAKGDETKTTKAKRRIFEIVIGLAAYAILWALLSFLLPGGAFNQSSECNGSAKSSSSSSKKTSTKSRSSGSTTSNSSRVSPYSEYNSSANRNRSPSNTVTALQDVVHTNSAPTESAEKLIAAGQYVANLFEKKDYRYGSPNITSIKKAEKSTRKKSNCSNYVSLVAQKAGLVPNGKTFDAQKPLHKYKFITRSFKVTRPNSSLKTLARQGKLLPGDIVGRRSDGHLMIYVGKKSNGSLLFYNGGRSTTNTGAAGGHYVTKKMLSRVESKNSSYLSSFHVGYILRPK